MCKYVCTCACYHICMCTYVRTCCITYMYIFETIFATILLQTYLDRIKWSDTYLLTSNPKSLQFFFCKTFYVHFYVTTVVAVVVLFWCGRIIAYIVHILRLTSWSDTVAKTALVALRGRKLRRRELSPRFSGSLGASRLLRII